MDLRSWVYGFNLSLAGIDLPFAVPFAYFNGVRLPRLPYRDTGGYPYAYISHYENSDTYTLVAISVKMYIDGDSITTGVQTESFSCQEWTTTGAEWVGGNEHSYTSYTYADAAHVWSNVAIGTKYTGTRPIPDYGGNTEEVT